MPRPYYGYYRGYGNNASPFLGSLIVWVLTFAGIGLCTLGGSEVQDPLDVVGAGSKSKSKRVQPRVQPAATSALSSRYLREQRERRDVLIFPDSLVLSEREC